MRQKLVSYNHTLKQDEIKQQQHEQQQPLPAASLSSSTSSSSSTVVPPPIKKKQYKLPSFPSSQKALSQEHLAPPPSSLSLLRSPVKFKKENGYDYAPSEQQGPRTHNDVRVKRETHEEVQTQTQQRHTQQTEIQARPQTQNNKRITPPPPRNGDVLKKQKIAHAKQEERRDSNDTDEHRTTDKRKQTITPNRSSSSSSSSSHPSGKASSSFSSNHSTKNGNRSKPPRFNKRNQARKKALNRRALRHHNATNGKRSEQSRRGTSPGRFAPSSSSSSGPSRNKPDGVISQDQSCALAEIASHSHPHSVIYSPDVGEESDFCAVCFYGYGYSDEAGPDELMVCEGCNLTVHESCYGIDVPEGDFFCVLCLAKEKNGNVTCAICSCQTAGAFKPVAHSCQSALKQPDRRGSNLQLPAYVFSPWAHIACAQWLDVCALQPVEDPAAHPPPDKNHANDLRAEVIGIDWIDRRLFARQFTCSICHSKEGAMLYCYEKECCIYFHVLCGLRRRWIEDYEYADQDGNFVYNRDYVLETNKDGEEEKIVKAYCELHDPKDRHGRQAEMLRQKNMKEKKEKLRLAAERKQVRGEEEEEVAQIDEPRIDGVEEKPEAQTTVLRKRLVTVRYREKETALSSSSPIHSPSSHTSPSPRPQAATTTAAEPAGDGYRVVARAALLDVVARKRGWEIEDAVFAAYPPSSTGASTAYIQKVRDLVFNLRMNSTLSAKVFSGEVSAEEVANMDFKSLAVPERQAEREAAQKEATAEAIARDEPVTVRKLDGSFVEVRSHTLQPVEKETITNHEADPLLSQSSREEEPTADADTELNVTQEELEPGAPSPPTASKPRHSTSRG